MSATVSMPRGRTWSARGEGVVEVGWSAAGVAVLVLLLQLLLLVLQPLLLLLVRRGIVGDYDG